MRGRAHGVCHDWWQAAAAISLWAIYPCYKLFGRKPAHVCPSPYVAFPGTLLARLLWLDLHRGRGGGPGCYYSPCRSGLTVNFSPTPHGTDSAGPPKFRRSGGRAARWSPGFPWVPCVSFAARLDSPGAPKCVSSGASPPGSQKCVRFAARSPLGPQNASPQRHVAHGSASPPVGSAAARLSPICRAVVRFPSKHASTEAICRRDVVGFPGRRSLVN